MKRDTRNTLITLLACAAAFVAIRLVFPAESGAQAAALVAAFNAAGGVLHTLGSKKRQPKRRKNRRARGRRRSR